MSTQDAESIDLLYDRDQQGLRLLELPPELVELLSGGQPPRLQLKSVVTDTSTRQASHVVLCTPGRTYELRQVQTSNSVYVSKTISVEDEDSGTSDATICAFAKCTSMLELQPALIDAKNKVKSAQDMLKKVLRTYGALEDDPTEDDLKGITKEKLFGNIPWSRAECETAWRDLIAFERHQTCWLPHAQLLFQLWSAICETATAEGIDLTKNFATRGILPAIEDNDLPEEAFDALLHYLSQSEVLHVETIVLDRTTTVRWVGENTVLTYLGKDQSIVSDALLQHWQNRLPESWRLEASKVLVDEFRAKLDQEKLQNASASIVEKSAKAEDSRKRPAKGRDWHERLKKAKK